jgi:hypothetical protein
MYHLRTYKSQKSQIDNIKFIIISCIFSDLIYLNNEIRDGFAFAA